MKRIVYSFLSVLIIAAFAPFLVGQQLAASPTATITQAAPSGAAPDLCSHLFKVGNSSSSLQLQYCVTANGNISSIETPFGHFHLGAQGEGYGLCQESPATEYHDYIVIASGWGAAQIVSATSNAIKISRSTADGNWTLVQTISKVAATASIKIVMALTNNQSVDKVAYLVRFADVDPDGKQSTDIASGSSFQSAFAWQVMFDTLHYGLRLENAGKWSGYQQGFVQSGPGGPNPCAFAFNALPYGYGGAFDSSLVYAYAGVVPAHKTVSVTLNYHGM